MKTPINLALIPIEKQFANIKRLVPEFNLLISNTAGLEKTYKQRFAMYSEKWDLMQATIFQLDSFKHLSEKDRTFVSTYVLGMMQKLIYAKRLSQESIHAYKVAKTSLHELLLELAEQYKEEGLRGDMPMFVEKFDIKLGLINRKKEELRLLIDKLKKRRAKKEDKVLVFLQKKRFPSFLKQVFIKMHVDLKFLIEPKQEERMILGKKISVFQSKKLAAKRKQRSMEGAAYGLIEKMLKNQVDFLDKVDKNFKDFHQDFYQAVQEFEK